MQDIDYSQEMNAYRISIRTPFWTAWVKLGWPFESAGLGVGKYLIEQMKQRGADLIVHLEYNCKDYRISNSDLCDFMKKYDTEYFSGVELHVFPLNEFTQFDESLVDQCKCHCGCKNTVPSGYFLCKSCVGKCLR